MICVGCSPPRSNRYNQVEPPRGSTAGGTELHITGAGFAYVTQVPWVARARGHG